LYVNRKSETSFEVRELRSGSSNVRFDYRIVALRKNYETIRLADHTHDLGPMVMPEKTPVKLDTNRMVPPVKTVSFGNLSKKRAAVRALQMHA
jgi:hypothetical protein